MIVVQLQGGLGNQIFQYAAALAVRTVMEDSRILFLTSENKHSTQNYFHLFRSGSQLREPIPIGNRYFQGDAFEAWNPKAYAKYKEIFLYGYFQFIPAIYPIIPQIQREFGITYKIDAAFIHVRRGDYLEHPTLHWVQPASYYEEGMKRIGAERWLLFSDDLDWCRQQPCFQRSDLTFVEEKDEVECLRMMAGCKQGALISNSTFSYWGAMLGDLDCVVYPKKWYGDASPILFPEGWMEL